MWRVAGSGAAFLRLEPGLAAEIEAERRIDLLSTTTAAAIACIRAGLDARRAARGQSSPPSAEGAQAAPPAAPEAPQAPTVPADVLGVVARVVFGLRANEFDAEAVAFRLGEQPEAVKVLPDVLREPLRGRPLSRRGRWLCRDASNLRA